MWIDNETIIICISKNQCNVMPGPCIGQNLLPTLITDSIEKRRGHAVLSSFQYNLSSKLVTDFNHYMD